MHLDFRLDLELLFNFELEVFESEDFESENSELEESELSEDFELDELNELLPLLLFLLRDFLPYFDFLLNLEVLLYLKDLFLFEVLNTLLRLDNLSFIISLICSALSIGFALLVEFYLLFKYNWVDYRTGIA